MKVKELSIADLRLALQEDSLWNSKCIPITKHRANALVHNPRANPDDIALFVAYDQDEEVIGYLGILPDFIFVEESQYKIGWMSAWWVDPEQKKTGIGIVLFYKAFNAYEGKIAVSALSSSAQSVCEATKKMVPLKELKGFSGVLQINVSDFLSRKIPFLKKWTPVLKKLDVIPKVLNRCRFKRFLLKNPLPQDIQIEYLHTLDSSIGAFIEKQNRQELTQRGIEELNWITQYPWVLKGVLHDPSEEKYYFSSISKQFEQFKIKVLNKDNQIIGFLIIQLRNHELKVQYPSLPCPQHHPS